MKTLLYGGSFDPPHNGHLNNLRAAAARVRPDRVVVMPAGLSPFKQHTAAPAALRLEIAQAEAGRRNYTVLTVEMLAAQDPEGELYLGVGSDMLLSFDGWHRWQDILRLAHLVVTSRNAGDAPELCAKARQLDPAGQRILFAPVTALPMASSALRQRLAAGEDCAEELPEAVRAVIRREHLYQT